MNVAEIMTGPVVTVGLGTPVKEVARTLLAHHIAGVPVVGDGQLLGIVSESDIVAIEQGPEEDTGEEKGRGLAARLRHRPNVHLRAGARTAAKAMTSPAIATAPWESVLHAAWLMCYRDVNTLPVVKNGKLVGIVTRADLVRRSHVPT